MGSVLILLPLTNYTWEDPGIFSPFPVIQRMTFLAVEMFKQKWHFFLPQKLKEFDVVSLLPGASKNQCVQLAEPRGWVEAPTSNLLTAPVSGSLGKCHVHQLCDSLFSGFPYLILTSFHTIEIYKIPGRKLSLIYSK